ncbi:MAG: hypothetical protein KatS3mg038_3680 [Candidatus Kapaibacterium sp.]|nr:MAG: hypothetical protein KatS3mg038_3680 [Candidatus Kapabacteria bacterium]
MQRHSIVSADELRTLQSVRGYPLITIAMPTHRAFPENKQDPIRFKDLVRRTRQRLSKELNKREVQQIDAQLAALADHIDWAHTLDGLIVFLGGGVERIVYLPVTVRERVIIDETFATRDLVVAQSKLLRYWVIALSTETTRLFEGWGDQLLEVESEHFPKVYDGPRSGDPDNPLPGGFGIDPSKYRDEQYRKYFRSVDRALCASIDHPKAPVVVIGVVRNRALFAEVRTCDYEIIAELDGSVERETVHQIAGRVQPALEAYFERRAHAALAELGAAISAGHYTCSLADMWHYSRQGRASLLIVERDYAVAGRWDEERKTFTIVEDPSEPGIIDDIVDDIIEATLLHHGRVEFVLPGAITQCQHIAMALRY